MLSIVYIERKGIFEMSLKIDTLMKEVNKKEKGEIFNHGLNTYDYDRIPFTSPKMNWCTYGGIPEGKITEFSGKEHGGKTTSALDIVANYQNLHPDRDVLYVDAENSLDAVWATKLGVDLSKMYIVTPETQSAETLFDLILETIKTGDLGLWVLDSIGALLSQDEWEKDMDEKTYAGISKPLTRFGKEVEMLMNKYNCTGLAINQMRDKLNSTFGGQTTPGGNAWRHFCMVRLEFSRGAFVDDKCNPLTRGVQNPAGNIVMMTMLKNKTCKPDRRTGQYTLNYNEGINYAKDLMDCAMLYDIVRQSGAWFSVQNPETGEIIQDKVQGQGKLLTLLEEDDTLLQRIEELVDSYMYEK